MSKKVFYFHTPVAFPGWDFEDRATVACTKVEGKIVYGIAICGYSDNFSRKKGRELAVERMEQAFGSCDFNNGYYDTFQEEDHAMVDFAKRLGFAIVRNIGKYKRRIGEFKIRHANTGTTKA
jgi:hypothetical protein